MATACNGCGTCCDPVVLPFTKSEIAGDRRVSDETKDWVAHHLHPMSRRDAREKFPGAFASRTISIVEGEVQSVMPMFYRCDLFDPAERRCTAYDSRPEPCRDYPWGGDPPNPGAALPAECSFNADVGRPVAMGPTRDHKSLGTA